MSERRGSTELAPLEPAQLVRVHRRKHVALAAAVIGTVLTSPLLLFGVLALTLWLFLCGLLWAWWFRSLRAARLADMGEDPSRYDLHF